MNGSKTVGNASDRSEIQQRNSPSLRRLITREHAVDQRQTRTHHMNRPARRRGPVRVEEATLQHQFAVTRHAGDANSSAQIAPAPAQGEVLQSDPGPD